MLTNLLRLAGKVLSGLIKRIDKDLTTMNCIDIADIVKLLKFCNNNHIPNIFIEGGKLDV
jgi:hypothetical protein